MALSNNDILKKLRVALKLRDDEIVEILKLVDFRISKSELGAFFRREDHPNYMQCQDQILRNFLNGLVIHLRGPMEPKSKDSKPKLAKSNDKKPSSIKSNNTFTKPSGKFKVTRKPTGDK